MAVLAASFVVVSCLAYSTITKTEAKRSSGKTTDFHRTISRKTELFVVKQELTELVMEDFSLSVSVM
jgi:hypothetical protein